MPTAMIRFGNPDDDRVDFATKTEHFAGNLQGLAGGEPINYYNIIVGQNGLIGQNPLGRDDTDTYAHADNADLEAQVWGKYPSLATAGTRVWYQDIRALQSDPIPAIPPEASGANLTLIVVTRASAGGAATGVVSLQTYPTTGSGRSFTTDLDITPNEWVRHEIQIPGLSLSLTNLADQRSVMRFGPAPTTATAPNAALINASWYEVAFFGVRVDWTLPAPLLLDRSYSRVVQRGSDGHGMTGGRRVVGGKSLQATNRRAATFR